MSEKQFFWLHIKKSAGTATRKILAPHYIEVDRVKKPKNFIQAHPEEYNDILNNYRIPLGNYQFKRCLFAKRYLYPNSWENLCSFAFSRNPYDRCVSMFNYLYWRDDTLINRVMYFGKRLLDTRKVQWGPKKSFDIFLDNIEMARESDSIYKPISNHFTTHTAPMWDDITDEQGNLIIRHVFRLESLTEGINQVFEECGIKKRVTRGRSPLNSSKNKVKLNLTKPQRAKIEHIYAQDFEVYEKLALTP